MELNGQYVCAYMYSVVFFFSVSLFSLVLYIFMVLSVLYCVILSISMAQNPSLVIIDLECCNAVKCSRCFVTSVRRKACYFCI